MLIPDINVLVYARREDSVDHARYLDWLERALSGVEPVGLVTPVMAGFLRVVTNPRVFAQPTSIEDALVFVEAVLDTPASVVPSPSARQSGIFFEVCRKVGAKGNVVPDAWLAATAIDLDATLVTADRGFARFAGLRWRHPLD